MNKADIEKLHAQLLSYWNSQDAKGMASLFCEDGNAIGFDGSQLNGRKAIQTEMERIFADHKTAAYVWKVEEVRFLNESLALLRAIVSMIPPGKQTINPERNAIQSLVVILDNETWKIALFQNTPAKFDGRPELVEKMTNELSQLMNR